MKTLQKFKKMENTKVTEREISHLIKQLMDSSEDKEFCHKEQSLRSSIDKEMAFFGNNVWGLFNGVTHYTSNVINNGDNYFGNVAGSSQQINNKAMMLLSSLI